MPEVAEKNPWLIRTGLTISVILNLITFVVFIFGGLTWITTVAALPQEMNRLANTLDQTAKSVDALEKRVTKIEAKHEAEEAIKQRGK